MLTARAMAAAIAVMVVALVFGTTLGARFVDRLVDLVAHESEVGYQALDSTIRNQIAKDAYLVRTKQVQEWYGTSSEVLSQAS